MRSMTLPLVSMLIACGGGGGAGGGGDDDANSPEPLTGNGMVFAPSITRVVVEIDYEQGNEPFTGPILGFGDTFDPTVANFDRLFAMKKTVAIPRTTGDMQNVGEVADEELTANDLLALAAAHRDQQDGNGTKTYYVIFVSGYFTDDMGPHSSVLGVSLGETGVIAMFKDVIRSTDSVVLPNVVRYVEQSTLVHELAHAFGLVDNGVPLTSDHRDAPHGAHCINDRCVMYYLNEGATDAAQYASMNVLSNESILFDASCLADADAFTGGP